ncbi:MAG: DUF1704 domain-containing protein [Candidatus Paceibacterota bacterium]
MKALDEKWFAKYKAISKQAAGVTSGIFAGSNKRERRHFLESEVENPEFKYKDLSNKIAARSQFEDLLVAIEKEEENPVVKKIYTKKIKDKLTVIDMAEATQARADQQFYQASVRMYGAPKKEYFAYIAMRIQEQCITCNSPIKNAAAKRLRKLFSKIDISGAVITVDVLPEPVVSVDRTPLTAMEVKKVFVEILKKYDIDDWKVDIDSTNKRKRFSVNTHKKVVSVPNDAYLKLRQEPLTRLKAEAVAEHEIGVHVLRSKHGNDSNLKLLGIGLSKYLRGEEGLACYMQQQVEGGKEFYGFERYMAASLAVGMDGTPRDFRSVYIIMHDYYTVVASEGEDFDQRVESAAWDTCVRIFRGTTGQSKGCIFTKDIVYLEGNIGIWKLLIDRPHVFESLFVGKFDPTSDSQVKALQALSILPEW